MNTKKEFSERFFATMLDIFPETKNEYEKHIEEYGERLDTVVIEDIFMPKVMNLLKEDNSSRLKQVFEYFERACNCGDEYLINIISITALEILGNDRKLLIRARKYMGPTTRKLQIDADRALGRRG